MNEKIFREIATKKDLLTLPMARRYANFCKPTLQGNTGIKCSSDETHGHLGDYDDNTTAEEAAMAHEHPVVIRYKAIHQASRYDF